jgi:hypothetical protein
MKTTKNYDAVNQILVDNIDRLLDELDVKLSQKGNEFVGACPVHGGKNRNSFHIYLDGHSCAGNWVCYTNHCEKAGFNRYSLIGFVQAMLSRERYAWSGEGDKIASFQETLQFIVDKFKIDLEKLVTNLDTSQRDFVRFVNGVKSFQEKPVTAPVTREMVRAKLEIPPEYFLNRGFAFHILNSFDVGFCSNRESPMYNRCVVPVYDKLGKHLVGATGRSVYEKCKSCGFYHNPEGHCWNCRKWIHTEGFQTNEVLYNHWNALTHIKTMGYLIVVESPGNVWKLFDAGFPNCVAVFGDDITDRQQQLLEKCGVFNIVLAFDNDEAGKKGTAKAIKDLQNLFNISVFDSFDGLNDLAEIPNQKLKELFHDYRF